MGDYFESLTSPSREVQPDTLSLWQDAGFLPAINGIHEIAKVLSGLAAFNNGTIEGVSSEYVAQAFGSLSGAIRQSLLIMTRPEVALARKELCEIYPLFNLLFNGAIGQSVFNVWVNSTNESADSPGGKATYLNELMQAFTKDNGEYVFEPAGDFDIGDLGSSAFKNTFERLFAEYSKQYDDKRPNSPPISPNPWECMIGGSRFYVPPININVSQNFKVSSLTGAGIRQKSSPKFNSGHSETQISMTIYFPNQDQIWGIGAEDKLDIDFNTADDFVIDTFLSSLRGLITQFKYAPFLPIKNQYINQAYGITGVAMQSMSISSVPDYPFCMAVTLNMTSFNHKVFLPSIDDFSNAFHWGKYRQYIGKAAEKMATELYAGYKTEEVSETVYGGIGAAAAEALGSTSYDNIVGSDGFNFQGFDRTRELLDATKLSLYYPIKTPLQVFAPDMSEWRSQGEDEIFVDDKSAWEQFVGALGIDVNTNKDAQYETLVNSYIPPSKNFSPLSAFVDFAENIKQNIDTIKTTDIENYIARTEEKYKKQHGSISGDIEDQIRFQTYKDWLNSLYGNWKNSDFYKKYAKTAQKSNTEFLLKEWDLPMDKFTFDDKSVIIDGVSVSMSNTFARLQIQMQDEPAYQHIGSGDSQVSISMTVLGSINIARFRELFNHINGLARLEHAHGVIGFLGIKNVLAGLSGIKYVMPLNFQVDTVEGYPNIYKVRLDFVDFDVFQQRREELSSDQQTELIKNFGKRNPFLRFKQMWGATNCYPDLPLSVRDGDGSIVGHLDPDFYFRAFQTIDDDTVNYLPSEEFRVNPDDDIPDGSQIYDQIGEALQADRTIGQRWHLMVDGTRRDVLPDEELDLIPNIAFAYAWTKVIYTYSDGAVLTYTISWGNDLVVIQEPGEYLFKTEGFDPEFAYTIYDYDGAVTGFFVPDGNGGHKLASNPGVLQPGEVHLSNSPAYGKDFKFGIEHHFPVPGAMEESVATLRQDPTGVQWGSSNIDTGEFTPETENKIRLGEDNPSTRMPKEPIVPGTAPYTQHSSEYDKEAVDSYGQFEMMMKDTQYRNKAGRMVRAFPTYMLWLIDEGGNFAGVKLYDNFYGLSSIQDFSIHQSEDLLGDTLVLRVSNLYQKLTNPSEVYASIGSEDNPFKNENGTGLIDLVYNRGRNSISGLSSDLDVIQIGHVRLKPGVRVHMRAGYSANPNALPTIFNGTITTVEEGDLVTITAQSDAVELSGMVNSTNAKGHSGKIDGGLASNLWLSEPRDLMITLLTQGVSTMRQNLAFTTNGYVFSENKYGIRHFGSIMYAALNDNEADKSTKTKEKIGSAFVEWGSGVEADLAESNQINMGYGGFAGASAVRDSTFSIMGAMWGNLFAERDYEIFKRNIYPGNGTGVAQFLGGDLMDGGEMLAVAGLRPDRNAALNAANAETNEGVIPALPGAIDSANVDGVNDGSVDDEDDGQGEDVANDWWDIGWSLLNSVADDPLGAADKAYQLVNPGYAAVRNWVRFKDNAFFKVFGLSGEVSDDDLKGFDEVSFRAQTYMKSVWDLFRVCANLLPNYIVAVRPFEDRSTVFYGKPHWLYTSGVIALTTGVPVEYEMDMVQADETMDNLLKMASVKANPIEDFTSQYKDLNELATTSYASNKDTTPGQVPDGAPVNSDAADPSIMGNPSVTASQIVDWWLNAKKKPQPSFTDINALAGYYIDLGKSEGVRGDLAFAQACNESAWFTSNFAVNRFNFAGIAAYDNNPGAALGYSTIQRGVLAHIQLLKKVVFGNDVKMTNDDVSANWGGKQTNVLSGLARNWATEPTYATLVGDIYRDLLSSSSASLNSTGGSSTEAAEKEVKELELTAKQKKRYAKEVAKESTEGAIDENIEVWYPAIFYKDQSKNVGHAARMLYDKEYFEEQTNSEDPKPPYFALGDTDIKDFSRSVDDANHIWDDLRITYDEQNRKLANGLFETYFKKRHSAVFKLSVLDNSDFYDMAYEEKETEPGGGASGFGERIMRRGSDVYDAVLNFGNPGKDIDTKGLVSADEPDAYKIQQNMYYKYLKTLFPGNNEAPTQADIETADEKLGIPELSAYFKSYQYLLTNFMRFLWYYSYNRAWIVITADMRADGSVLPWTDYDIDNPLDSEDADEVKIVYDFDRVQELWVEYLDIYDNDLDLLSGIDYTTDTSVIYSPQLWEWMANNNQPGNDTRSGTEKAIDDLTGNTISAIGELITATATAIAGVVNLFRTQLMQLGIGMSMAGRMQRASNALNSMFNDSIYYSEGEEGSILRMADNPFTREYGEPVVEIREPFQRIHYIDSFQHILANTIQENTSNVFTKVTAVSDGNYPVTVYLDKGMPSNMQYETTIETGIYWDNPTGKGFFSILHPLLHPVETARGMVKATTGSSDEILSKRIGLAHLKESLKDIYGGELWITGNPDIRPHDLVYLSDIYSRMYGMFEVESITHHFTPDLGFVSVIVPNAVVTVNDPARWSLVSWIYGRFAVQTIRNDTRRLMQSRNIENSLFANSNDVSLDELYQSLDTQFRGNTQYSQGSSAIIKDMAALDHYGSVEYAQKQLEEDIKGSTADALIGGGLNALTLGLGGKAWDFVRDNLLDQQGCYIQYLTKDGDAMDAGLSYAQGVAVGRHHSKTLLPGILGLQVADVVDGHTRITKDDLLSEMGWSELDISAIRQDVSWWVDKTNAQVLDLAGKSPDEVAFTAPEVHLARVTKVRDGDTIEVAGYGGDAWGDSTDGIRFLGVAAAEALYKDHEGVVDDPFTLIDETTFDEVNLSNADNKARLGQEYIEEILINKPVREGRTPVVAIRLNKYEDKTYGRSLGTIFHNAPTGVAPEDVPGVLLRLASKWPLIPWDAYMDDGRPYTANWSIISAGYANVDIGGISMMDYENGGS